MIMYNQLLKRIIENKDSYLLFSVSPDSIHRTTHKVLFKALQSYYKKYNVVPSYQVLKSNIEQQMSEEKAPIYVATLDNIESIETEDISHTEIINNINDKSLLHKIDDNIEKLVDASKNKDVPVVKMLLKGLVETTQEHTKTPVNINEVEYVPSKVRIIEAFLPTFNIHNLTFAGLTIIGGSSGGGKSIFTLQQLMFAYKVLKLDVCLLNLEIAESDIIARMYSMSTDTEYADIYGKTDTETISKINKWKQEYFSETNQFKIKSIRYNSDEIEVTIRNLTTEGFCLFGIDYLQIVDMADNSEEWKQLSRLVKTLHQLTLELGIVILSPVQVNFSDTAIKNNELTITVRGSRELLNSSTVFIFIYQSFEEQKENIARVFTLKARNARKVTYLTQTAFNYMKFVDTGIIL